MIVLPDRYKTVVKLLSGGGMSNTFVCLDRNLQRNVVVKTLRSGIEKHRLMDELSALADIRSKYVVQVFDVIYNGTDIVGFVEEFIEGKDLEPLDATVNEIDALKTLYSIAAGIADIHAHGRLHRDIKPENLKRDNAGVPKIFDFGLAKLTDSAKTQQLYFSKYYTAPEVFAADHLGFHTFTPAVDVFAFGVTALWLLSSGKLIPELGYIPPAVSALPSNFNNIPVKLATGTTDLLNRCLSSNPATRPTAADISDHIGKQLLRNKHRMLIAYGFDYSFVDYKKPSVKLSSGSDAVTINYDGYNFVVTKIEGHVRHNNNPVSVGYIVRGSSVLVLGDPTKRGRTSITADISHPEVLN